MITNTQVASTTTSRLFLASGQTAVTTVIFCNVTTNTNVTIDGYCVPNGSNANSSTQIMKALPLTAGETFSLDSERLILENGDALYAQASVGACITVTVSSLQTS